MKGISNSTHHLRAPIVGRFSQPDNRCPTKHRIFEALKNGRTQSLLAIVNEV